MAVNYEQGEYSSGMSAKHNNMVFVKNGQYSDGLETCMKTLFLVNVKFIWKNKHILALFTFVNEVKVKE